MDGDLQDPPEVIPNLIEEQAKGFDVVYVRRVARKERWTLRVCYFLFYRLISLLSDVRLPLDAGDFAVLSRRVVDVLWQLPEHHRYLRGLRSWTGFRQAGILVARDVDDLIEARHRERANVFRSELLRKQLDAEAKTRSLLTPSQREKFDKLVGERRGEFGIPVSDIRGVPATAPKDTQNR